MTEFEEKFLCEMKQAFDYITQKTIEANQAVQASTTPMEALLIATTKERMRAGGSHGITTVEAQLH